MRANFNAERDTWMGGMLPLLLSQKKKIVGLVRRVRVEKTVTRIYGSLSLSLSPCRSFCCFHTRSIMVCFYGISIVNGGAKVDQMVMAWLWWSLNIICNDPHRVVSLIVLFMNICLIINYLYVCVSELVKWFHIYWLITIFRRLSVQWLWWLIKTAFFSLLAVCVFCRSRISIKRFNISIYYYTMKKKTLLVPL